MTKTERVLAIVPARGGSKGIKRKNLQELGGHPLVSWPLQVAARTSGIDRIVVSTDDDEIAAVARSYDADVDMRPAHLATDSAAVFDVLLDLRERLRQVGEDARLCVLLEPTSPFRSPELIAKCLSRLTEGGFDSSATFCECRTNPHRAWTITDGVIDNFIPGANPWLPRQALPPAYELTGEVYAFDLDMIAPGNPSLLVGRSTGVVIDADDSVDINTPPELELARLLFADSPLADLLEPGAES
jgi:N-acylneuraminate cytidylyltransferase